MPFLPVVDERSISGRRAVDVFLQYILQACAVERTVNYRQEEVASHNLVFVARLEVRRPSTFPASEQLRHKGCQDNSLQKISQIPANMSYVCACRGLIEHSEQPRFCPN